MIAFRAAIAGVAGALGLGVLASCSSLPPADEVTLRKLNGYGGASIAVLREDRALYVRSCAGCHSLPLPSAYSEAAWRKWMPPMVKEARLDPEEARRVERFVAAMRELGP